MFLGAEIKHMGLFSLTKVVGLEGEQLLFLKTAGKHLEWRRWKEKWKPTAISWSLGWKQVSCRNWGAKSWSYDHGSSLFEKIYLWWQDRKRNCLIITMEKTETKGWISYLSIFPRLQRGVPLWSQGCIFPGCGDNKAKLDGCVCSTAFSAALMIHVDRGLNQGKIYTFI